MNRKKISTQIALFLLGSMLFVSVAHAQEGEKMPADVKRGMELFDGSESFENGGPACITCHNVTNDELIAGGLFAKDLTGTSGAVAKSFASSLPNAPMKKAFEDHPLTPKELDSLAAFFDYASEVKDAQHSKTGYSYFLIGGAIGLIVLFLFIQLFWANRKKKMVKESIFARQHKAWDAKF